MSLPAILTASAALENTNLAALGIKHAFDMPPEVLTDLPVAVRFAEGTAQMHASRSMGRYNIYNFKIEVHWPRGVLSEGVEQCFDTVRAFQELYTAHLSILASCDVSGFRSPAVEGPLYLRYGTSAVETIGFIFYLWAKEIRDDISVSLSPIAPPPGNGLLNNLIAYWPGNEVAGNALDLHTNALHLTDVNGVTSNPGVVYPWSRQYTRALNRYHTRPGDDALLSTGDVDFTIAACVWLDSKIGVETIASKDTMAMPNREYWLGYFLAGDRFFLQLTDGTVGTAIANTLGAPALGAWYLVIGWHDSVANTVNIQVNNGGADVVGTVGAPADTGAIFQIGRTLANQWDGRIGPTMFWKSAPGAGGVKTPAERLALWNGGTPLRYDQFTV